jgi:hypothetical protein
MALPNQLASGAKSDGRFDKRDFVDLSDEEFLSLSKWRAAALSLYE